MNLDVSYDPDECTVAETVHSWSMGYGSDIPGRSLIKNVVLGEIIKVGDKEVDGGELKSIVDFLKSGWKCFDRFPNFREVRQGKKI